jgi:NADPH:quinone reductase-like Zn-dependent oxidoreductase
MRAAIFERQGLENLNIKEDVEQPTITDHDVLIKVKAAGVNPIDHFTDLMRWELNHYHIFLEQK